MDFEFDLSDERNIKTPDTSSDAMYDTADEGEGLLVTVHSTDEPEIHDSQRAESTETESGNSRGVFSACINCKKIFAYIILFFWMNIVEFNMIMMERFSDLFGILEDRQR